MIFPCLEEKEHLIRFMNLLGIFPQKPSLNALTEIVSAYLKKIPFENISKLYYYNKYGIKGIPPIQDFLDGVEYYNLGGTCYTNNYFLNKLLKFLGYNVKLCSADKLQPGVHMVNIVNINDKDYLVDAGYAAPFFSPLPLFLDNNYELKRGNDFYILRPKDQDNFHYMQLYRNGILKDSYKINPAEKCIDTFSDVIEDSYRKEATFINSLLLVKLNHSYTHIIYNYSFIELKDNTSNKYQIRNYDELEKKIYEIFNIPTTIISSALSGIEEFCGAWD